MKFDAAFVLSFLIGIPGARPAPLAELLVRAEPDTPLAIRYINMAIKAFPQVVKTHPDPPSPSEDNGRLEANSKTDHLVVIKEKTVYSKTEGAPNPGALARREDSDSRSSRGCIIPYPTSDQPETELEANSDLVALAQTLKRIDGETIEHEGEPRRRDLEAAFDGRLAARNDSLTDGAVLQRRIIGFPLILLFNFFKKFEKKQEKREFQRDGPWINDKDLADIKQLILEIAANHFPESLEEVSKLLLSGNDNSADGPLASRDDSELDGFIINKPSIFTVALIECVQCYIEKLSSTESTAEQPRRPLRKSEPPTEVNQTELDQLLGETLEDHLPEDPNGLSKLLPRDMDSQVAKRDKSIERRNPLLIVLGVYLSWAALWAVVIPVTSTAEPARKGMPGNRRDLEVNPLGEIEPVFDANFTHLVLESLENTSQEEIDKLLNLTVYDSGNMRPALNHDLTLLLESLKNMSLADVEKLLDPAAHSINNSATDAIIERRVFNFILPVIELSGFVAWITMEYAKKNPAMAQRRDLALFGGQGEQARARLLSEVEPLLLSLGELSPEELDELIKRLPNHFSAEDRAVIRDYIFKTARDALDRKGSE